MLTELQVRNSGLYLSARWELVTWSKTLRKLHEVKVPNVMEKEATSDSFQTRNFWIQLLPEPDHSLLWLVIQ